MDTKYRNIVTAVILLVIAAFIYVLAVLQVMSQ
jgi:hypothetical protein